MRKGVKGLTKKFNKIAAKLRALQADDFDALVEAGASLEEARRDVPEELRQNPETAVMPVIVVSTESSQTRIAMLQKKGASFVHKPFTPEILRETIIGMTGVSYEKKDRAGILQDGGPDF